MCPCFQLAGGVREFSAQGRGEAGVASLEGLSGGAGTLGIP